MELNDFYVELYDADNIVGTNTIMYPSVVYNYVYGHTHNCFESLEAEKFCNRRDLKVGDTFERDLFKIVVV